MNPIFIVILILWSFNSAAGFDPFYHKKAEGWHWYEEKKQKAEKVSEETPYSKYKEVPMTPTEKIEAFKQEIKAKLHQAIVEPTPKNVQAYMEIQQKHMEQSHEFGRVWQKSSVYESFLRSHTKIPHKSSGTSNL